MRTIRTVSLVLCVVLLAALLTGCSSRTAATPDSFQAVMEAAGFTVENATETIARNDVANVILVASKDNYGIEFWNLNDAETAQMVFRIVSASLSGEHSVKFMEIKTTANAYGYYAFTANGNFHVIARIDNTMLLCEAEKEHKSEILDIIKQLGYK